MELANQPKFYNSNILRILFQLQIHLKVNILHTKRNINTRQLYHIVFVLIQIICPLIRPHTAIMLLTPLKIHIQTDVFLYRSDIQKAHH